MLYRLIDTGCLKEELKKEYEKEYVRPSPTPYYKVGDCVAIEYRSFGKTFETKAIIRSAISFGRVIYQVLVFIPTLYGVDTSETDLDENLIIRKIDKSECETCPFRFSCYTS